MKELNGSVNSYQLVISGLPDQGIGQFNIANETGIQVPQDRNRNRLKIIWDFPRNLITSCLCNMYLAQYFSALMVSQRKEVGVKLILTSFNRI